MLVHQGKHVVPMVFCSYHHVMCDFMNWLLGNNSLPFLTQRNDFGVQMENDAVPMTPD